MNFLRLEDVAEVLNLSRTSVYRLAKMGELPCYRFGGAYRVREDQLAKYIQEKKDEQEARKALLAKEST